MQTRKILFFFITKRFIDFSFSFLALIFLSLLLLMISVLIWYKFGRPVFYIQQRPGRYNKPFKIIKFRTMSNACDKEGKLLPDHTRTTGLGRFIRRTSIDELPEFFNVLKGDMSLVGPRPLLVKYLPYYTEREKKRHDVRPGLTGLAQVNGRNLLTWDERLELDVQYVENLSVWQDIKILILTIINVIQQKDVLSVSSEHIPDFDDYRKDQLKNK